MTKQAQGFLRRNKVRAKSILHLSRENGKTVITMTDGSKFETYIPLKALVEELPENTFQIINKGIALNSRYIVNISGRTFTIKNGETFEGRLRGSVLTSPQSVTAPHVAHERRGISSRFAVLDTMQVPFCVLSLGDNQSKRNDDAEMEIGTLLTCCYCNKAFADMFKATVYDILGRRISDIVTPETKHSLKETFERTAPQETDDDVSALIDCVQNGANHTLLYQDRRSGKKLAIYCFQPQAGHVACGFSLL